MMTDMVGKRQFSGKYLLGLVAAFAVSLQLTMSLLSTLPRDGVPLGWICLLFFETAGTVYIWGLFVCDLFGLTKVGNRWRNLGPALITLMLLGTIYALFLPA